MLTGGCIKDATPYEAFELIPDFEVHLQDYIRKRDGENAQICKN